MSDSLSPLLIGRDGFKRTSRCVRRYACIRGVCEKPLRAIRSSSFYCSSLISFSRSYFAHAGHSDVLGPAPKSNTANPRSITHPNSTHRRQFLSPLPLHHDPPIFPTATAPNEFIHRSSVSPSPTNSAFSARHSLPASQNPTPQSNFPHGTRLTSAPRDSPDSPRTPLPNANHPLHFNPSLPFHTHSPTPSSLRAPSRADNSPPSSFGNSSPIGMSSLLPNS